MISISGISSLKSQSSCKFAFVSFVVFPASLRSVHVTILFSLCFVNLFSPYRIVSHRIASYRIASHRTASHRIASHLHHFILF